MYTWMANAIDVEVRSVKMVILGVTGATFFLAHAVPDAFTSDGEWFSVPYFIVRIAALGLYWHGTSDRPDEQKALLSFVPLSTVSPLLILIGGFLDADIRPWIWLLALALDMAAALNSGRAGFKVNAAHFAERHGLFVIISFGEAIIVVGSVTGGIARDATFMFSAAAALVGVFVLWWSYFDWTHGATEQTLSEASEADTPAMARDLFTFAHFPIVAGILLYAVAVEEVMLHPDVHLEPFGLWALGLGFGLFLGGFIIGHIRATGHALQERSAAVGAIVLVVIFVGPSVSGATILAICVALTTAALVVENVRKSAPALKAPVARR